MRRILFWLAVLLIFMIPWQDMIMIEALGSLARLMGFVVAGFWMVVLILRSRMRKPHAFHILAILFILWNVISIYWTQSYDDTMVRIRTFIQLFILVFIIWDLFRTPDDLVKGLQAYVLGSWVAIASAIINYINGTEFRLYTAGRYTATGINPVDFVLILALGLPLAWYLAVNSATGLGKNILRLVNFAFIPAALFAMLLTGGRTALFVILPALFYIFITSSRLKVSTRIVILVALVVALMILLPYLPQSTLERLSTVQSSIASADLGGRVYIWKTAISLFVKYPILGIGSGAFRSVSDFKSFANNTFLSVLVETGFIGFVFFGLALLVVLYQAFHQPKQFTLLWLTVLLIWTIGVSTLTWEQTKPTWLFLSLVVVSAKVGYKNEENVLAGDLSINKPFRVLPGESAPQ